MKLGDDDIRKLNWFGLKRAAAAVLGSRLLNPLVQLAGRALLPTRLAQRLPLARAQVSYRLADGSSVYLLDTERDIIARDIYFGGGQPTTNAERLKLRCIERLAKEAKCFIDVGAYAGICALIAARSNSALRAIAYEIVPENYILLSRNIIKNDLARRVEPRLCGIGAVEGTMRLPSGMNLPSNATSISLGSRFAAGVAINIRDLDSQTANLDGPFFLKIDVEGYEKDVFDGGTTFFVKHKPDIICEVLPDANEACDTITSLLKPLGYRWFVFLEEGVVEREEIQTETIYHDWLLSARADIDEIMLPLHR